MQANTQKIERIESRLETLVENQQARLSDLQAHEPGFFASRQTKAAWSSDIENAQDHLQTLNQRLSRVEELEEQSEEMAEDKMREREPELAKSWDAARQADRSAREQQRQANEKGRARERSREQRRELEL